MEHRTQDQPICSPVHQGKKHNYIPLVMGQNAIRVQPQRNALMLSMSVNFALMKKIWFLASHHLLY